jgi:hypothetical protein
MKKVLNIVSVGLLSLAFASCSLNGVENITEQSTANFPVLLMMQMHYWQVFMKI